MIKEIVQFMIELSSVFNRIHFLLELKTASGDDRIIMLEYITQGQMACIGEIARRIYHHTFSLLIRDLAYFEDRSLVLGVLSSLRVSFHGKVATLVRYHRILSILLRTYYLQATIQDQIQSQ